jgi:4-alpha-glucanotransferase
MERIKRTMEAFDLVRIDHFRGFESFWAVPAEAPTAEVGEWRTAPGHAFFVAVKEALGDVPFIAEDLGIITDAVVELRDAHHLPGMKILQFAFSGDPDHPFLPHTYPTNCVAYTGTHDNDTSRGWYEQESEEVRHRVRSYLSHADEKIVSAMMESVTASKAALVVFPLQDILNLPTDARMNTPGTSEGNWRWRVKDAQMRNPSAWQELARITKTYER